MEHGVFSIAIADAHTSVASSQLNWSLCQFKWTHPFHRKTKSGFCACAITFQTQSSSVNETGSVCINVTLRLIRITIIALEKQEVLYILSASVALVMQHAKQMHNIILSSLVSLGIPYFSTLHVCQKWHDFWGKKFLNIQRVFWFSVQLLLENFHVLRRILWDTIIIVH